MNRSGDLSGERSHFLPQILYSDNTKLFVGPQTHHAVSYLFVPWPGTPFSLSLPLILVTQLGHCPSKKLSITSSNTYTYAHTLLRGHSVLTHAATASWAYTSAMALVILLKWSSYVLLCPTSLLRNKSDEDYTMCLLWIAEISGVARNVQSLPLLQSYSAFGWIQGLADTEDWIWYLAPQPSNTNDRFRR